MQWAKNKNGFTIAELIIVIAVIAILAIVTLVSYTGIRNHAVSAKVQSELDQAHDKVAHYVSRHAGKCPSTLAEASFSVTSSTYFQYSCDNSALSSEYAITASDKKGGSDSYYKTSTESSMQKGVAPGHDLLVWDEPDSETAPLAVSSGVAIDTTKFKTSNASMRLSPGANVKYVRGNPYGGSPGQVLTVTAWVLTDSTWNGLSNNSKIRYGAASGGALITAGGDGGVKTTWTLISCSYTLTTTYNSIAISFGNDGTTGNVWVDDISISVK